MNLGQFDPASIADSVTGGWWSTVKSWFAPVAMIGAGLVAFGILTQDKVDGLGNKIMSMLGSAKDWAMSFIDGGEGANVRKGLQAQLDKSSAFSSIDTALNVKGLGEEVRKLTKEAAAQSDDPIKSGIALHSQIVATAVARFKDQHKNWNAAEVAQVTAKAEAWSFEFSGLESLDLALNNPANITTGYVGMLLKTKQAKEAEGTLQANEVAPISINTAALQQAVREAAAAVNSGVSTGGAPTPPKSNQPAAHR